MRPMVSSVPGFQEFLELRLATILFAQLSSPTAPLGKDWFVEVAEAAMAAAAINALLRETI